MKDAADHWDAVYAAKASSEVSWFQATPTTSLRLLERWASPVGSVLDVGSGAATLVESLLDAGWVDITVLDISQQALNEVRHRLGRRATEVCLVTADVRFWQPHRSFDAWHDRAVFHFLVEPTDRDRYVTATTRAVAPGGVLIVGTFAADGPTQCSGLPTARYDTDDLARAFGPAFVLEHAEREVHTTPAGAEQPFSWVVLRHVPR